MPDGGHAADDGGADQGHDEGAVGRVEHADDALVAGEQTGNAARRRRVDGKQFTGHIDHARQTAVARHVDAVVVARAQVQIGETAVFELGRQGRIAADQGRGAEVVALGLEDLILVDDAELADAAIDGADVVGLGQRTGTGAQRACEKVVEARVVRDVRVQRLIHVDVVAADEPADQTRGHGAAFGAGDPAGKVGQRSFWKQILRQDGKTVRHDGKPLTG
ncbi:hypothetical protein D3C87_1179670 [compost metagenome]